MTLALLRWRTAIACAALAAGCSSSDPTADDPGGGDAPPIDPAPDPDPKPQPPLCGDATSGSVLFSLDTGSGGLGLHSDLAIDAAGNVLYTREGSLAKYTPDGALVFRVPYGEVVAVDAAGNIFVAASFKAAIDIGLGAMVPEGNVDVFVAELAPDGRPLFARPLRLCGDGVRSIAVSADGRIAVSGAAMGTIVLDARGVRLFEKAFSGDVAFDSKGSLVVAGSVVGTIYFGGGAGFTTAGDADGFVVKLDAHGDRVWSARIGDASLPVRMPGTGAVIAQPTRQLASAIAIDARDEVVLVGRFDYDVALFGTDYLSAISDVAAEPLRAGGFTVTLDAAGAVVAKSVRIGLDGYADVAVDRAGNVIATGMELAEAAPPFRYALLTRSDGFSRAEDLGAGHAVAADACGNIVWSASMRSAGPDLPLISRLIKLAR